MKIFIINGQGGVGKDQFVTFFKELVSTKFPNALVENLSTVDRVKDIAKTCGWDGTKTEKNRWFLSELKDLLTKWNDVPFSTIARELSFLTTLEIKNHFVFIHCREPNEIQRFVEAYNAKTILIKRDSIAQIKTNHADAEVENYNYDYVINNNGTLDNFKLQVYDFITLIKNQD